MFCDHGSISKAISIIENDLIKSKLILADLYPNSKNAMRIGITGPPGAGKTNFVNAFEKILRQAGEKYVGFHAATGADCMAVDDSVSPEWVASNVQPSGSAMGGTTTPDRW